MTNQAQLLESSSINQWFAASPAEKAQILMDLFHEKLSPIEPYQLAALSTYMYMEGYNIPNTTKAMIDVLRCFEAAGAVEIFLDEDNAVLMVKVKNGSR